MKNKKKRNKGLINKVVNYFKNEASEYKMQHSSIFNNLNKLVQTFEEAKSKLSNTHKEVEDYLNLFKEDYYNTLDYKEAALIARDELLKEIDENKDENNKDKFKALVLGEGRLFKLEILDKRITEYDIRLQSIDHDSRAYMSFIGDATKTELFMSSAIDAITNDWKRDLAMYSRTISIKNNLEKGKIIKEATNNMKIKNAEMMAANRLEIAKMSNSTVIEVKTMEQCQKIMYNNLVELKNMSHNLFKERHDDRVRLEQLSKKTTEDIKQLDSLNVNQYKSNLIEMAKSTKGSTNE